MPETSFYHNLNLFELKQTMGCGMENFPYEKAQNLLISHNVKAKDYFENRPNTAIQLEEKNSTVSNPRSQLIKKKKKKVNAKEN